ncbi:SDR family NAD(P)-dependent oxidoreductase [Paenibacillus sp. H1-7]|uniref:NAD-dependent epimerase/dehydratase family protein n=1 Tax=Paenibacillus sp. H1-7 TaxID=2282849 RepID=UPI001EF7FD04|nr:NAD-dependent epimerase/dehydratase family protein [Paenibacillus sp. H1-7]ULL16997.1 SDR family NAD(P)-dependent oxidoreductase [Paenibacillus sp. H1-7]
MKKIIVTGAAGFLGSCLTKRLLAEGNQVVGIDNMLSGRESNIAEIRNKANFTFIRMDVVSQEVLTLQPLKGAEEIYHLASPASPKFYQAAALDTIAVNTIGTKNMLELAKANGAKMLYTSTSEAYGDPEIHPQQETYRGNVNTWGPRACYDEAKRLGEVYCYEYYHQFGAGVKVARIFNTYSANLRNDDGRVISNFVNQALRGQDITVYGDGSQTRSFCYVDDTLDGLMLMMGKDSATGEIINVGNPDEYSVLHVAELVKKLAGSNSRITFHSLPKDDPKVRRPVIDKAIRLLGWKPQITLEEGLIRTIDIYRSQLSGSDGGERA